MNGDLAFPPHRIVIRRHDGWSLAMPGDETLMGKPGMVAVTDCWGRPRTGCQGRLPLECQRPCDQSTVPWGPKP